MAWCLGATAAPKINYAQHPYMSVAEILRRCVLVGRGVVDALGTTIHSGDSMTEAGSAAFWSYAHEDDRLDGGSIQSLATDLANEYSLMTGESLEMFFDRTNLLWGEEWRRRIDGALVETSFFIPILTPRYFQRTECRKEATTFHGKAKGLGVEELILPVLYAPLIDFDDSNSDELISLLSKYQYVDWTGLRLEGSSSSVYRKAVHSLAQRLIDASVAVAARQMEAEAKDARRDETKEDLGLLDLMEKIKELLPDWLDAVDSNWVGQEKYLAVWKVYGPRLDKLEASPGSAGPKFALIQKLAMEFLPMSEGFLRDAQIYEQKSLELDPLIQKALHLTEGDADALSLLEPLHDALALALQGIEDNRARKALGGESASVWARKRANISRLVRQTAENFERGERLVTEVNDVVINWGSEWERVTGNKPAQDGGEDEQG